MSDPTRLRDRDPLFAAMVQDARRDDPPPRALERVLARVTATASATSVSVATTTPSAAAASGAAKGTVIKPTAIKIALSALLATGALAVVLAWPGSPAPRAPAPGRAVPIESAWAPAPPSLSQAPPQDTAGSIPTFRVEDLPSAGPAVGASTARARPPAPASSASADRLHEELDLIEGARRALAAGDLAQCLRTLDRYDQSYKEGRFADEVAVTRIEALLAAGQGARAAALGRRFIADRPGSPPVGHVQSLLRSAERKSVAEEAAP
jgi:hypothetical protein